MEREYTESERAYMVSIKLQHPGQEGTRIIRRSWDDHFTSIPPSRQVIAYTLNKFNDGLYPLADAPRSGTSNIAVNEPNKEIVATYLTEQPSTSTRRAVLEIPFHNSREVSRSSYRNIVKEIDFFRYRYRKIHHLLEPDPVQRSTFCYLLLQEYDANPHFINNIIWSDEAQFKLDGMTNCHNSIYYDSVNPHVAVEKLLNQPGFMVWGV